MDVRNGDVLAMESSPSFNPNYFIRRPALEIQAREMERWTNSDLEVQIDHAMYGRFEPGSIFKTVVGMAALELGVLDPKQILPNPYGQAGFPVPGRGRPMGDTAPPESARDVVFVGWDSVSQLPHGFTDCRVAATLDNGVGVDNE